MSVLDHLHQISSQKVPHPGRSYDNHPCLCYQLPWSEQQLTNRYAQEITNSTPTGRKMLLVDFLWNSRNEITLLPHRFTCIGYWWRGTIRSKYCCYTHHCMHGDVVGNLYELLVPYIQPHNLPFTSQDKLCHNADLYGHQRNFKENLQLLI